MAPQVKVALKNRISVEALKALEKIFAKGGAQLQTAQAIAVSVGISRRTVCDLQLIDRRRPDLLPEIFADRMSISKAAEVMKAQPEKWKTEKARTRF